MGKNAHGPRNAGGSKKSANSVPDSDHIVFTNEKDKSKKQASKPSGGTAKAGPSKDGPDQQQQQPPRPDARKVIGGESWTGKLPQTLLSEHCQKQKWMKPDFSMRQVPGGGYQSSATLSTKNMKTGEVTTLPPFLLPPHKRDLSTQPTALEARHFAAAWALFRISSMKNIHMMLPPKFRDLWKGEFAAIKKEDLKAGLDWMYAADPFAAKAEKDAAKVEADKRREALAKEKEKAAKENKVSFAPSSQSGASQRGPSKAWQKALLVELGNGLRSDIEEIVRRKAIWNPYNTPFPRAERVTAIKSLVELGFRQSHVEEAIEQCKDQEEALEWLLIYVPEDDLPPWAFPEGYSAGITFASGNLAREAALKRLAAAGYPMDGCQKAYKQSNGKEALAAAVLQSELCDEPSPLQHSEPIDGTNSTWQEELTTLESIYGDRFSSSSDTSCTIVLLLSDGSNKGIEVKFLRPPGAYPHVPPTLALLSRDVPAYIRLSATRQVLEWAELSLLGEPMMFGIVDWLEGEIPNIMKKPGKLREISLSTDKSHIQSQTNNTDLATTRTRRVRTKVTEDNRIIYESWKARHLSPQQQKMLRARQSLPAWSVKASVVDAVHGNQVTIISGETGSGKSTQSVQFVLDDMIESLKGASANILCTQPRRISALGLADRVSAERCSAVGEEVGYIIRGDSKISPSSRITFMTTGVLLRRLQSFDMMGSLQDVSHIVVDEVHERSLDTDFLLALLRDALPNNPHLKVILMSATLDAQAFIDYFGGVQKVGLVNISGRTYPVQDFYLDDVVHLTNFQTKHLLDDDDGETQLEKPMDELSIGKTIQNMGFGINYDLITATVRYIDESLGAKDGAILVFLPGTLEIDRCLNSVSRLSNIHALPLHASLMPAEQKLVFLSPPNGRRKVIAATNVAETSITIEDVVAVIDTGRVKETVYDSEIRVVRLEEVWASQAACKQRRGRAGRVRAGDCYKLFTRKIEQQMAPRPLPEIRRVPLEQLCLSVKATDENRDVASFLRETLTPPEEGAIDVAVQLLHQVGALEDGHLTSLGRYLALIPADLRCAKLLVYGSIFSCLEPCLTVASILTVKSPFVSPRDKRDEAQAARSSFSDGNGDLLLDLKAYNTWSEMNSDRVPRREIQNWCSKNFLSSQTLRDISSTRSDLLTSLKEAGLIPPNYRSSSSVSATTNGTRSSSSHPTLNRNSTSSALLRALVAASLSPQTAQIQFPPSKYASSHTGAIALDPEARTIKYFERPSPPSGPGTRVFLHPSTSYFHSPTYPSTTLFLSYFSKLHTSKLFIRDLTPFNLYTLLLFGQDLTLAPESGGMLVDGGWIKVRGWARIGVLVSRLRRLLDTVVVGLRVERPQVGWGESGGGDADAERIVELVTRLVEWNGMDR